MISSANTTVSSDGWITANFRKELAAKQIEISDSHCTNDWRYSIFYLDRFSSSRRVNAGNLYLASEIAKTLNNLFSEVTLVDNLADVRFCVAGDGFKRLGETDYRERKERLAAKAITAIAATV